MASGKTWDNMDVTWDSLGLTTWDELVEILEVTVINFLDANITDLTKGTNLGIGRLRDGRDVPAKCVAVSVRGGVGPLETLGNFFQVEKPQLVIDVRGPENDYITTKELAESIYFNLVKTGVGGYMVLHALSSGPGDYMVDNKDRPYFTMVFEVWDEKTLNE